MSEDKKFHCGGFVSNDELVTRNPAPHAAQPMMPTGKTVTVSIGQPEPPLDVLAMINELRGKDGDTVVFMCDNPEASTSDTQCLVECCGEWTNWAYAHFYGKDLVSCLRAALFARRLGLPIEVHDMPRNVRRVRALVEHALHAAQQLGITVTVENRVDPLNTKVPRVRVDVRPARGYY